MNDKEKRVVDISTLTEVSDWLAVIPITEIGFELSKHQFWDLIRLLYGWEISNLLTFCPWGSYLIFSIVWLARKVALYTYDIVIYET